VFREVVLIARVVLSRSAKTSVPQKRPFRPIVRSAKKNCVTCPFCNLPAFLPKSTRKRSVRRSRSFRKAFVPQISPFRKKSVTCSASFLVSRICSNSSFLTLARRRHSNCRFVGRNTREKSSARRCSNSSARRCSNSSARRCSNSSARRCSNSSARRCSNSSLGVARFRAFSLNPRVPQG